MILACMKPSRNRNFSDLFSRAWKNTVLFRSLSERPQKLRLAFTDVLSIANKCKSAKEKNKTKIKTFFKKSKSRLELLSSKCLRFREKFKNMKMTRLKATKQLAIIAKKVRVKSTRNVLNFWRRLGVSSENWTLTFNFDH